MRQRLNGSGRLPNRRFRDIIKISPRSIESVQVCRQSLPVNVNQARVATLESDFREPRCFHESTGLEFSSPLMPRLTVWLVEIKRKG